MADPVSSSGAASVVSGLEGAGMSSSSADSFVSGMGALQPGRTHYLDADPLADPKSAGEQSDESDSD